MARRRGNPLALAIAEYKKVSQEMSDLRGMIVETEGKENG